MLMVKVFAIAFLSLLDISDGERTFVISSDDDSKAARLVSELSNSRKIIRDNIEQHNIQIRAAHVPTFDLLKKPSILIGKLKSHLGFGHKPSDCFHHKHEDFPSRDFNHDRHNFDESERLYKHDFHHHGSHEFHNHGDHWTNNFPHQEHFPGHKIDPINSKHKPDYHNEKPNHQHPYDRDSTNDDEKVSTDYISSTPPQIDIRSGAA